MEESIRPSEISKVLREELRQIDLSAKTEEVGEVLQRREAAEVSD